MERLHGAEEGESVQRIEVLYGNSKRNINEQMVLDADESTLSCSFCHEEEQPSTFSFRCPDVLQLMEDLDYWDFLSIQGNERSHTILSNSILVRVYSNMGMERTIEVLDGDSNLFMAWNGFVCDVRAIFAKLLKMPLLNSSVLLQEVSASDKYIVCSVEFQYGGPRYSYLSPFSNVEAGDKAWVFVEGGKVSKVVTVVNVEIMEKEQLPLPLEKLKYIAGLEPKIY